MIKIKNNIFNENKIIQMSINEENNLVIEICNDFPRVIKDANFSDIEWNNEDKQIIKCLDSIDREEELENKLKELKKEYFTLEKDYGTCELENSKLRSEIIGLEEELTKNKKNSTYLYNKRIDLSSRIYK